MAAGLGGGLEGGVGGVDETTIRWIFFQKNCENINLTLTKKKIRPQTFTYKNDNVRQPAKKITAPAVPVEAKIQRIHVFWTIFNTFGRVYQHKMVTFGEIRIFIYS